MCTRPPKRLLRISSATASRMKSDGDTRAALVIGSVPPFVRSCPAIAGHGASHSHRDLSVPIVRNPQVLSFLPMCWQKEPLRPWRLRGKLLPYPLLRGDHEQRTRYLARDLARNPEEALRALIRAFVRTSPENRLRYLDDAPIYDEPLVAYADGDDPLFDVYKTVVGPFHLTPREVWQAAPRGRGQPCAAQRGGLHPAHQRGHARQQPRPGRGALGALGAHAHLR